MTTLCIFCFVFLKTFSMQTFLGRIGTSPLPLHRNDACRFSFVEVFRLSNFRRFTCWAPAQCLFCVRSVTKTICAVLDKRDTRKESLFIESTSRFWITAAAKSLQNLPQFWALLESILVTCELMSRITAPLWNKIRAKINDWRSRFSLAYLLRNWLKGLTQTFWLRCCLELFARLACFRLFRETSMPCFPISPLPILLLWIIVNQLDIWLPNRSLVNAEIPLTTKFSCNEQQALFTLASTNFGTG